MRFLQILVTAILLAFQLSVNSEQSAPYRFYAGLALGVQSIDDADHDTAAMRTLSPYDMTSFAERISVGYFLTSCFAVEAGMSLFSGYNYQIQPYDNSVHRDIDAFDLLAKLIYPLGQWHVSVGAGAAVVYSDVQNFSMIFPEGDFAGQHFDDEETRSVIWGDSYFIRPEFTVGVSFALSSRISLGVVANYILSDNNLSSSITMVDDEPALLIDSGLPSVAMFAVVAEVLF